jgi:hypothetical protein
MLFYFSNNLAFADSHIDRIYFRPHGNKKTSGKRILLLPEGDKKNAILLNKLTELCCVFD